MQQYAFSFDVARCSGCMACVVACQDQNDFTAGAAVAFRHVTQHESRVHLEAVIAYLSLSCQHCGDAPCIGVCPRKAITRDSDGTVLVDPGLCIGCHSCAWVCPFGAPKFTEKGKMTKCDLCAVRREQGMKPACVCVCPTGALDYGTIVALGSAKPKAASIRLLNALVRTASQDAQP